jgi:hypothetical protein
MNNDHSEPHGHHLVSAHNVLKLTVDCLVVSLVEHKVEEERQTMIVDLYQELAQWCADKASGRIPP